MRELNDGIWIIDAQSRTTYASNRMCEILGVSAEEIAGQLSFDYLYPEDMGEATRLLEAKMRGDTHPFRFRLRRKNGSSVWVLVQGTPLHSATGHINGIVGTFAETEEQQMASPVREYIRNVQS